jgi:hypothetical protein
MGMLVRLTLPASTVLALGFAFLIAGCGATAARPAKATDRKKASGVRTVIDLTASQRRAAANQAAARRDVRWLFDRLVLPAGAKRVADEPRGDNRYLRLDPDGDGNAATHGWWELPGSPAQLIAFVRSHPPAGSARSESGNEGNLRTGTSALTQIYQWPAVRGVLGLRELQLTATVLPNGRTGVEAQSFSGWIRPRPSNEQIPADIDEINVTIGRPQEPPTQVFSVTKASEVRAVVKVINSLSIVQSTANSCVLEMDPQQVTITFSAASQAKPVAVLTYLDFRPWGGPSDACKSVALTINGRNQDELIGGDFLRTIGRILNRSLTRA